MYKPIKSFVLRQGRLTLGQKNAIDKLMPKYGLSYKKHAIDLDLEFNGSKAPKVIEIGSGMGECAYQNAQNNPLVDYIAIEVHSPGIGALLMALEKHNIANLRIIHHDAKEVVRDMLMDNSIYGFHIYFPDPWQKKRHNKRRLIQAEFITLLYSKLQLGGYIHLATDSSDYANEMLKLLSLHPALANQAENNGYIPRPTCRPLTKFEQRALELNHTIYDLKFEKVI